MVASLGRQKRFADAFDYCEKEDLWSKCPPEVVGGVCEALLYGYRAGLDLEVSRAVEDTAGHGAGGLRALTPERIRVSSARNCSQGNFAWPGLSSSGTAYPPRSRSRWSCSRLAGTEPDFLE